MSLPWINNNAKLQTGITLINSLNRTKFNLLLKHIIQSETDEIFTNEELKKLEESLKLNETNLQLLILSIAHILKQSFKIILKPTQLQKQLINQLKLDSDKAEDFVQLWTNETKQEFDLELQQKLETVKWELNLQNSSSACNKETLYHTRLELGLVDMKNDNNKENIILELDETELITLYGTLENIQNKLDTIIS